MSTTRSTRAHVPFHELATAAYCPRKLYYQRIEGVEEPPPEIQRVRELAFDYSSVLSADQAPDYDLDHDLASVRHHLRRARSRFSDAWPELTDPSERDVLLEGTDCRGMAAKVLHLDPSRPPVPSHVSAGEPPENGVWESDGVRAVAAAKALSYREEAPIDRAFVEYPRAGAVREVQLTTRRKAAYRRVLRTVRSLDGPPPRLADDAKCGACEFRERCGVQTRSLSSLLGLG